MDIRHRNVNVKQTIKHTSLELEERSKLEALAYLMFKILESGKSQRESKESDFGDQNELG